MTAWCQEVSSFIEPQALQASGLSSGGAIDNWGHIGGLIGGALFAWVGGPRLEVQGNYPLVKIVDTSEPLHAWNGAALVLILFGALTLVGIYFPFVP